MIEASSSSQSWTSPDVRNQCDFSRAERMVERLVQFLRTHLNVADFFTKGLPKEPYCDFKRVLMGSVSHNH